VLFQASSPSSQLALGGKPLLGYGRKQDPWLDWKAGAKKSTKHMRPRCEVVRGSKWTDERVASCRCITATTSTPNWKIPCCHMTFFKGHKVIQLDVRYLAVIINHQSFHDCISRVLYGSHKLLGILQGIVPLPAWLHGS
jgi:hypothetical protein